jgi:3-oxoacyl-[acyl-carrier protein] reductase
MLTYDLSGKTALITGAASGIGRATAEILVRAGARVAINFLPGDARGAATVAELAALGDAIAAPGDVADAASAASMVESAVTELDRLDLLVNNAGTPGGRYEIPPAELDRITEELWSAVLETNLLGTFRCTKAAAAALRSAGGAVVNVASIAGIDSAGSSMAYGASKAGIISLTKNLARSLAPEVRVNAVAPGSVDSTWQIEWTAERNQGSADGALLKRRCTPEDIAEVIVFLGCAGRMVTAQTVVVDGGLTLP